MRRKRKLWTNGNKAWLLKSDGPVKEAEQEYLEERGLNDVTIADEEPQEMAAPDDGDWVEEEMQEPEHGGKSLGVKVYQANGHWWFKAPGHQEVGPFGSREEAIAQLPANWKSQHDIDREEAEVKGRKGWPSGPNEWNVVGSGTQWFAINSRGTREGPFNSRQDAMYEVQQLGGKVVKGNDYPDFYGHDNSPSADEIAADDTQVSKRRNKDAGADPPILNEGDSETAVTDKGPPGYKYLRHAIKAMEENGADIENPHVQAAIQASLKEHRRAMRRAYKDLDDEYEKAHKKDIGGDISEDNTEVSKADEGAILTEPEMKFKGAMQDCVSAKISKLVNEGKDQDQAAAIAFSICGEHKSYRHTRTKSIGSGTLIILEEV